MTHSVLEVQPAALRASSLVIQVTGVCVPVLSCGCAYIFDVSVCVCQAMDEPSERNKCFKALLAFWVPSIPSATHPTHLFSLHR